MTPVQALAQELADECIHDDCGADAGPQHEMVFRFNVRDDLEVQDEVGQYLHEIEVEPSRRNLFQTLAGDIMRDDAASADRIIRVLHEYRDIVLKAKLIGLVENAISDKMGGWEGEPEEGDFDDAGGML